MTNAKKSPTADSRAQHAKFVEAARELGCDEDPEAFKDKLKKLVKAPPPESVQRRKETGIKRK